jgi:hypothetical protein
MSKQLSLIYFTRDQEKTAKDIAAAIRNQGHLANMVYANNFNDVGDCINAAAVAIQVTSGKVSTIADAYRKHLPETEVHFFNEEGDFVDGPAPETPSKIVMPSIKTEGTEQNANADADKTDPSASTEEAAAVAPVEAEVADDTATEEGDDTGAETPKS